MNSLKSIILLLFSLLSSPLSASASEIETNPSPERPLLIVWNGDNQAKIQLRLDCVEGVGLSGWKAAEGLEKVPRKSGNEIEIEQKYRWKMLSEEKIVTCKRKATFNNSEIEIQDSWEGEGHPDAHLIPEICFEVTPEAESYITPMDGPFVNRNYLIGEWIASGFKHPAYKTKFVGSRFKAFKVQKWNNLSVEVEFDEVIQVHFETQQTKGPNGADLHLFKARPYIKDNDTSWTFIPGSIKYKLRIKKDES